MSEGPSRIAPTWDRGQPVPVVVGPSLIFIVSGLPEAGTLVHQQPAREAVPATE